MTATYLPIHPAAAGVDIIDNMGALSKWGDGNLNTLLPKKT